MRRRAFTLIEVMIAVGVFALMAVVLVGAVAQIQEAIFETRADSGKEEFRQFVMRRALGATDRDKFLAGGAAALPDGSSVNWSVIIEPTSIPDLHEVTIDLTWGDSASESLFLRAYRPEWSDADERSVLLNNLKARYPADRLSTF
jgi:prepilin-type N-terminal cleavage/methylation domain-containing protein